MQTDPEKDYARGWVPFLDCRIRLESRPLIPRMETEYWTEQAITDMRAYQQPIRCLDIFAGSGAIGIAILKHVPGAMVDFGEIDASHFPTVLKSLEENGIDPARTRMIETDVWENVNGRYEFVVANPPYLSEKHLERIQESVLAYEPPIALFAEEDGFALIRKAVVGAPQHLAPGGTLYLEHDPEQSESVAECAEKLGMFAETRRDQFGLLRYSILRTMA